MRLSSFSLLATGVAASQALAGISLPDQSPNFAIEPFAGPRKRQLMSCEQTYGRGSINCGDSTFCYNPSAGQSCCNTDFGYCERGSYCAPVAGFCCLDGESLFDCARLAGFDLPATVTQSLTATVTVPRGGGAPITTAFPVVPTAMPGTTLGVPGTPGSGPAGGAGGAGVVPGAAPTEGVNGTRTVLAAGASRRGEKDGGLASVLLSAWIVVAVAVLL